MQRSLTAFLAGLLFGLGLVVSHMIDPAKVLAFLDIAGNWDPSLAFVMIGAIPIAAIGFWVTRGSPAPRLDSRFHGPSRARVDRALAAGAVVFGVGWGLIGFCPGPAVASLTLGRWQSLVFVAAMLVGMAGYRLADRMGVAIFRRESRSVTQQ